MMAFFALFIVLLTSSITEISAQKPKLEIQPNSKEIQKKVGEKLAITCRPNVPDPQLLTNWEWRDPKNRRIEGSDKSQPISVQALPSEPGLVLMFARLTENQEGVYTCNANYAVTEKLSESIKLTTYEAIEFVNAPENQYPIAGEDFKILCKVKGNPSPIIDWSKNERTIVSNEKYVVDNDELLVKNVTELDDGEYTCQAVVLSTGDYQSRNIKLEVQVPPRIEPMQPVIEVIEGETASTICKAYGKPPPKYTWIKENTREDLSKTDRFGVKSTSGELIITRVEFNDNSMYTCLAENPAGRANYSVKINVIVKPRIYELLNVTTPIHQETKISCKVYGRPPPSVVFRKLSDREPFEVGQQNFDKRIVLEQQFFEEKGETWATLIISNLNRSDDGLYECIAKNKAGEAYKNGHITVEFPPTFERTRDLPPFFSWEGRPGNISCLPEAIPNATVIWRLGGRPIENSEIFRKERHGAQFNLIINAGNERRLYTSYECLATNKLGEASVKIHLKQGFVPGTIQEIKPLSITATTVKFQIVPPSNFDGLPIRSYTVQYRPEREYSWDFARNHTWSYGAPYILEGLIPEVTYFFRFAARNDVGLGPFVNAKSITMPRRSEPAEPRILLPNHNMADDNNSVRREVAALSPYADHFELRWNVPSENGDAISHYSIRYCMSEKVNGAWQDSKCSEDLQQSPQYTHYQLTDLQPDTIYKIELRAHNSIGGSSPAQIRIRTAKGMDEMVPLKRASISSSTIIGIVIGAIILVLIFVDIMCFCVNRTGIIALLCDHTKTKHSDEEDPKLGRGGEEREPLKSNENGEKPMTVEYDGRQVYSKSGEIIGKHSAV